MPEQNCTEVRQAIELVLTASTARVPTRAMSTHAAGCPRCQAAIHDRYLQLMNQPAPPAIDCEQCQADLAVYIDTLLSKGASAAACELPQVWWHIWQCADCAETFELTLTLIDAELRGELMPMASLFTAEEPLRPIVRRFHVRPETIAHLFSAQRILGMAYGSSEEIIVREDIDDGYTFRIDMQRTRSDTWSIVVSGTPPIAAMVVFTIGNLTHRVAFDNAGRAMVHDISTTDLQNADTGIAVAIEALD
jgi:hypothetical protein